MINSFNDCTPTNRRHPPSGWALLIRFVPSARAQMSATLLMRSSWPSRRSPHSPESTARSSRHPALPSPSAPPPCPRASTDAASDAATIRSSFFRTQGVDRWQLKLQRAGDKTFDEIEARTLQNVFSVPDHLQQACPPALCNDTIASSLSLFPLSLPSLSSPLSSPLARHTQCRMPYRSLRASARASASSHMYAPSCAKRAQCRFQSELDS